MRRVSEQLRSDHPRSRYSSRLHNFKGWFYVRTTLIAFTNTNYNGPPLPYIHRLACSSRHQLSSRQHSKTDDQYLWWRSRQTLLFVYRRCSYPWYEECVGTFLGGRETEIENDRISIAFDKYGREIGYSNK